MRLAARDEASGRISPIAVGAIVVAVLAAVSLIAYETWPTMVGYALRMQGELHRQLADAIRAAQEENGIFAWTLILLSFAYGVFHAVGPGHGKVVIATYLGSQRTRLRRGIVISVLSSMVQGVTAIVAVSVTVWALDLSVRAATEATGDLELTSYLLVALLGAYLSFAASRRLLARYRAVRSGDPAAVSCCHGHAHGFEQDHGHNHDHAHGHDHDAPGRSGLLQALVLIGSVGIRPCSGAILVLMFAFTLDLTWSGIAAVLAMSAGTALTVSTIAVLTVVARTWIEKMSKHMPEEATILSWAGDSTALAGGLLIVGLGLSLAASALKTASHPLF